MPGGKQKYDIKGGVYENVESIVNRIVSADAYGVMGFQNRGRLSS